MSGQLPTPDGDESEQDIAQQDQDWEESRQFVYSNLKQDIGHAMVSFYFPIFCFLLLLGKKNREEVKGGRKGEFIASSYL